MTSSIDYVADYERSTASIASFVESLRGKVKSFEGEERRSHARFVVALPSVVQPLDEYFAPSGRAFNATVRDISIGGIGLLHAAPVTVNFLEVRLKQPRGAEIRLLVQVLRCHRLGAYFDTAGEFVTHADISRTGLT